MTATDCRRSKRKSPRRVFLVLEIDDTYYSMEPNRSNPSSAAIAYRLRKTDGTIYDVSRTPFGLECDCPDFLFRRAGLDPQGCKHIQALVACGVFS